MQYKQQWGNMTVSECMGDKSRSRILKTLQFGKTHSSYTIEKSIEVIDACHALQYQILRDGSTRKTHEDLVEYYKGLRQHDSNGKLILFDLDDPPLEPDADIMGFISEHSKMPSWKRDIIEIVIVVSKYFIVKLVFSVQRMVAKNTIKKGFRTSIG